MTIYGVIVPRPSLKDQRSREILNAFVACAARYGLEGATQERIALEAGVKRTLLRHYLGNRDQMIEALCAHVVGEFDSLTDALRTALSEEDRSPRLVELLFDTGSDSDPRLVLVFQALVAAIDTHPAMRTPLLASLERFVGLLASDLQRRDSARRAAACEAVAHGLAALYMTADALAPLAPPREWRTAQKCAAVQLIETLEAAP